MSLLTPAFQEPFMVRIYKELNTSPTPRWANTYEMRNENAATYDDVVAAAMALVEMEEDMHLSDVRFNRVVISTAVPDGSPYDPATFTSIPLVNSGNVVPSGQALPLQVVLSLKRKTVVGRQGKLFYRRALGETDVESPSGNVTLTTASESAIITRLATAMASSGVDDLLTAGTGDIKLIMMAPAQIVRLVDDITVYGATIAQYNNRYYDVP